MATKARFSAHAPNQKRTTAKLARGFGSGAIEKLHTTEKEWSKAHDPLFGIKGIERWMRLKAIK